MPKYIVAISRLTTNGWHRSEIGNFIFESTLNNNNDPEVAPFILDTLHIPIQKFPTDSARCFLVKACQERKVDFLMMLDSDSAPKSGTFKAFFTFLRQQTEPSVIAAPYCSGDGKVQAMVYNTDQPTVEPLDSWKIFQFDRDFAARKTGIERVASIGTHNIMFDMRVFDKIKKPYFRYIYSEDHTEVIETEDCWCLRQLFHANVPVYCHWDYWSDHYKETRIMKPPILELKNIPEFYQRQANSYLFEKPEPNKNPIPIKGEPKIFPKPLS